MDILDRPKGLIKDFIYVKDNSLSESFCNEVIEKFDKDHCVQVFLHYNKEGENENLYDGRKHIGLPL